MLAYWPVRRCFIWTRNEENTAASFLCRVHAEVMLSRLSVSVTRSSKW